jgi:hypothetical protein
MLSPMSGNNKLFFDEYSSGDYDDYVIEALRGRQFAVRLMSFFRNR